MCNKFIPMTLSCVLLTLCLAASANADQIENLVFTGTATCENFTCSSFGSGPLTGTYTLDVTTQSIVGAWAFSTPFGLISSTDTGATATVGTFNGTTSAGFGEETFSPPFKEYVILSFPGESPTEIGAITLDVVAGCNNDPVVTPGSAGCFVDYALSGSTALVAPTPEPSSIALMLAGIGVLVVMRKRTAKGLPQAARPAAL
jgi:hypothetical protein